MATTTFNYFAGSTLPTGSFLELHSRNSQLITAVGAEKLRLTEQLGSYAALINQLHLRVNATTGFEETPEVTKLDNERDSLQKFAFWTIMYASELPTTFPLYAYGNELRVVSSPYKSIAHHELTRQTGETKGFCRDLKQHPEALAALNLTAVINELERVNNLLAEKMGLREETYGDRKTEKGSMSTPELRKAITTVLEEIAIRINASAVFLSDDASVGKLISDLNGVADHYRLIAGSKTSSSTGTAGTAGGSENNNGGGTNQNENGGSEGSQNNQNNQNDPDTQENPGTGGGGTTPAGGTGDEG